MKYNLLQGIVTMAILSSAGGVWAGDPLEVGDDAPEFSLVGSDGDTYRLADFRDKQVVVVAWFPKAFTGG